MDTSHNAIYTLTKLRCNICVEDFLIGFRDEKVVCMTEVIVKVYI